MNDIRDIFRGLCICNTQVSVSYQDGKGMYQSRILTNKDWQLIVDYIDNIEDGIVKLAIKVAKEEKL